ncbi:MAG: ABC transporter substrate-binding protein [Candidimonas sp.]
MTIFSETGMKRRSFLAGTGAALATPFLTRSARSQSKQLILPTYGGSYQEMIQAAYTDPFTQETGVEVIFSGVPDFARLKAQVTAGNVEWDVFEAGGAWFPAGSKEGLFEPLDPGIITETDLIIGENKDYAPFYDTPYGIAWNSGKYDGSAVPRSCAEFWDVDRFPGTRSLRGRADFVLEIALVADGVDPADLYPLDLDRAFAALERLKPSIPKWAESTSQLVTLLTANEVDYDYVPNGRVRATEDTATPLAISMDQAFISHEYIGVVKGTPRRDTAMEFVAFALRPDRQAAFSELISYLPGNRKALDLVSEDAKKWLPDMTTGKHIVQNDDWWAAEFASTQQRFQEFLLL